MFHGRLQAARAARHFVPVTEGENEVCFGVVLASHTAGGTRSPAARWGCHSPEQALGSGTVRTYPAARGVSRLLIKRRERLKRGKTQLSQALKNRRQPVLIY